MRLRELRIQLLPGIAEGFALEGLDPGVNVIIGPNASGKSSVLRALRAALYPEEQRDAPLHVEALFEDGQGELKATRLGRELTWQRHGQSVAPPPLPEHRFLSCYTLRIEDLLDADGATDQEIAQRLARELAGGYDLHAVRDNPPFQLKQTHGRTERVALEGARRRQREKQIEHQALREHEERLAGLRADKDACAAAAREAEAHGKALELLDARRRRLALERQSAAFPTGMDRLQGDERTRLERLRQARGGADHELEQARRQRDDSLQDLTQTALDEAAVDEAAVADRHQQVQQLQRLEGQIEQLRAKLDEAAADRQLAIAGLGGAPERPPRLQPETLHRVEAQLADKRRLDAELRDLDAALAGLPTPCDDAPRVDPLRQGRDALLGWLGASPEPGRNGVRAAVITALTVLLIPIGAAAVLVHWALALLGAPLAAGAYLLLQPAPGTRARDEARRRFTACDLAEPSAWQTPEVMTRLGELDRALQAAERQAADLTRREALERRRTAKADELGRTRAALAEVAAQVGFDPQALDSAFGRWLHLVSDYDRAHGAAEGARAALEARSAEAQQAQTALMTFLAEYNEAPPPDSADSETLGRRLARLNERVRRRDAARRDMAAAEREIERTAGAIEDIDGQVRELFAHIGVEGGDDAGLAQRLDQLDSWKKLKGSLQEIGALERDREQALGDRPDLATLIDADDRASLQMRCEDLRGQAAQRDRLLHEIAGIEKEIDQATRKRELEEARAASQAAEDALGERLDEALFAAAGAFLLDQVRDEHVHASQPPALRRAAEWFQRFTHHQFALEFAADGEQRFAARETATDERRPLAELSSGTRMQLLLAVRIAFALEAERGREPLPLVLDEALTTADPERFEAAAGSLVTLAREDRRQVFYMTAQPGDMGYWNAHGIDAHRIDLAKVRRIGRAVTDGRRIALPASPEVPAPGGQSPEDYAVTLGVPPVDPWSPPAAVHVFYLLRDDLALLRRLVQSRHQRIGPLRALLGSPAAQTLLTEDERHKLQRRIAGVEPWFEAWRRGRGRPVDRQALQDSQAVSPTFLDSVTALNDRLGGDARALLKALEDGQVDRFRANKREELGTWLMDHGYLDEHPTLTDAQISHHVLAVLAPFHDDPEAALGEAQALAASLEAGLARQSPDRD